MQTSIVQGSRAQELKEKSQLSGQQSRSRKELGINSRDEQRERAGEGFRKNVHVVTHQTLMNINNDPGLYSALSVHE
jgi:hypothetical protein